MCVGGATLEIEIFGSSTYIFKSSRQFHLPLWCDKEKPRSKPVFASPPPFLPPPFLSTLPHFPAFYFILYFQHRISSQETTEAFIVVNFCLVLSPSWALRPTGHSSRDGVDQLYPSYGQWRNKTLAIKGTMSWYFNRPNLVSKERSWEVITALNALKFSRFMCTKKRA